MTAAEIRQSFLDFFREKQHTAVPSASLMPQSPGLLFTNAGMNQFVPYFLGTEKAPYAPPRATDTQKCIRAGGKHNDLEDVGYDTYHHTFFEMLGNWSFGDYFKKEAIEWGWELIVERWGVPAERLYATVYAPSEGDPSEFDQEAYDLWADLFKNKGLDPSVHIVNGNVKDNFWMMGETGPCGPCSELHVDLTPKGDSKGSLVNMDSDLCIEIWNLVFIQYNAEADGSFRDLPAKHVDTGMGFERACSLIQNTKGFTDFSQKPTNYATDVFQPIFRKLEELSGRKYVDVYPEVGVATQSQELQEAIAFRVIADHIRTLSFSIADGILPGRNGRNSVLRSILRRAVNYGRTLGFTKNDLVLEQLVDVLLVEFGSIFPEIIKQADFVKSTLREEETLFNKTLDRGSDLFDKASANLKSGDVFPGGVAYDLYSTYGFPEGLTRLKCKQRELVWDDAGFELAKEKHAATGKAGQQSEVVRALDISSDVTTEFVGFDNESCEAEILEVHEQDDQLLVVTSHTVLFTEMGGQDGDTGTLIIRHGTADQSTAEIYGVQKIGAASAHMISKSEDFKVGDQVTVTLNKLRRAPIEAHHTATHLLHWALHEVVSQDATQQGSSVSPERLRFDFNSKPVNAQQIAAIEEKVNASISNGDSVSWIEVPHGEVKDNPNVMQFFGDKYGDLVRVVQIGGEKQKLDGYSMELCGGTHVTNTKDIGLFKIKKEEAIASGVRRIEAVCGAAAESYLKELELQEAKEKEVALAKLQAANEALVSIGKDSVSIGTEATAAEVQAVAVNAEKTLKKAQAGAAAAQADALLGETVEKQGIDQNMVIRVEGVANLLQELMNGLKKIHFSQAAFFIVDDGNRLHLGAFCGEDGNSAGFGAGNLIKELAPIAGGKGGGKPDVARGAAPERAEVDSLFNAAKEKLKV